MFDTYTLRKDAHISPMVEKRVQIQNKSNITMENNKENTLFNQKEKTDKGIEQQQR